MPGYCIPHSASAREGLREKAQRPWLEEGELTSTQFPIFLQQHILPEPAWTCYALARISGHKIRKYQCHQKLEKVISATGLEFMKQRPQVHVQNNQVTLMPQSSGKIWHHVPPRATSNLWNDGRNVWFKTTTKGIPKQTHMRVSKNVQPCYPWTSLNLWTRSHSSDPQILIHYVHMHILEVQSRIVFNSSNGQLRRENWRDPYLWPTYAPQSVHITIDMRTPWACNAVPTKPPPRAFPLFMLLTRGKASQQHPPANLLLMLYPKSSS